MRYYFDWDPDKARTNLLKHKVSFEEGSTIFIDPRTITVFDDEHGKDDDRWATIGIDMNGRLLVVIHTFQQIDNNSSRIRIISARKAIRKEIRQYQKENK